MKPWHFLFAVVLIICAEPLSGNAVAHAQNKDKNRKDVSGQKIVAVIPIQKSVPQPLFLSNKPDLYKSLRLAFKEKSIHLNRQVDYDPDFVIRTLGRNVAEGVLKKGFRVYTPKQVEPHFDFFTASGSEIDLDEFNQEFHADAFLFVTITEWNAEAYQKEGIARTGFHAVLIDAASKQTVWSNDAVGLKLEVPSHDFLYSKMQTEILHILAGKILKGFPAGDWQGASYEI